MLADPPPYRATWSHYGGGNKNKEREGELPLVVSCIKHVTAFYIPQ